MSNFKLNRSPGFAVEIAGALRQAIENDTYKKGERLPTERELSEEFGVSRAVIREATTILKTDGVIESFQGKGLFVATDNSARSFRLIAPDLRNGKELAEIMEFLIAHEVEATGLAAVRRTAADLKQIHEALIGMEQAIASKRSGVDEDLTFHRRIVSASKNSHFVAFNNFLEDSVRKLIRAARDNTSKFQGLSHKVQAEHQSIYDAIVAKDADAARLAAEDHLRRASARLKLYHSEV